MIKKHTKKIHKKLTVRGRGVNPFGQLTVRFFTTPLSDFSICLSDLGFLLRSDWLNSFQMYNWRLRLISQHECNRLFWLPTNWKHRASNLEDSYSEKSKPFSSSTFFSLLLTVKSNVSETLFLFILLFLPLLPIVVTGTTPWKTNLKVLVPHTEYSI